MTEKIAEKVGETIIKNSSKLVAKPPTRENSIAALKEKTKDKTLPIVMIDIPEEHVGKRTSDPEFALYCTESGFTVLDKSMAETSRANIRFVGEALSERGTTTGTTTGNLVSVKARVELKAIDRQSGKIIAIDRQTTVAVDLSEQIVAKIALQQAGAILAERMIPKIVK